MKSWEAAQRDSEATQHTSSINRLLISLEIEEHCRGDGTRVPKLGPSNRD